MERIIFGSLYQAKEGLYFNVHFFFKEELSIYVARQSGVAFPLYKQAPRPTIRVLTTLSGAALRARLHKAESYISWLHSPFHHIDEQKRSF